MDENMLVPQAMQRLEGVYNCVRPVYEVGDWVDAVERNIGKRCEFPMHLNWDILWPRWAEWLKAGIE